MSARDIHILLIDDDAEAARHVIKALSKDGYTVSWVESGQEAMTRLLEETFDLLICEHGTGDIDPLRFMEQAAQTQPGLETIFLASCATVNEAVEAMAGGAFYYLAKPVGGDKIRETVLNAVERRALAKKRPRDTMASGATQFIGRNRQILRLKDTIAQIAQLDCNVLITGETGTGKELVARIIHELSPRADKRFLPINCAALTEELMLNELFGHEKDAFTGASRSRKGLFESAQGGVVLLDEVGETPLQMQVKLLRALQEKRIIRVGGTEEIPIDIRFIAATNRDLQAEVRRKTFRQDLYYRLNVVSLHIPALRERRDDIPALVRHFLAKYPAMDNRPKAMSDEAMAALMAYDFPGNVRELENIIERVLATCVGPEIKAAHLPVEISGGLGRALVPPGGPEAPAAPFKTLKNTERRHILTVLRNSGGNQSKAAKILGISRVSLWRKLKKYQDEGVDIGPYLRTGGETDDS